MQAGAGWRQNIQRRRWHWGCLCSVIAAVRLFTWQRLGQNSSVISNCLALVIAGADCRPACGHQSPQQPPSAFARDFCVCVLPGINILQRPAAARLGVHRNTRCWAGAGLEYSGRQLLPQFPDQLAFWHCSARAQSLNTTARWVVVRVPDFTDFQLGHCTNCEDGGGSSGRWDCVLALAINSAYR